MGAHSALADLAFSGDAPLLIVRHAHGDCISIASGAVSSVWPFPDALKMDAEPRVSLELQDRAPLSALCATLASAGIAGLVAAMPHSPHPTVTLPVSDLPKVGALLPNLGLVLGETERLAGNPETASGNAPKVGKMQGLLGQLALSLSEAKASPDVATKRESSASSRSGKRKRKKSDSSSSTRSKRSRSKKKG